MRRRVVLIALLLLAAPAAFAKDTPEARTQALVDTFKQVKTAPEGGTLSEADKKANVETYAHLDDFFDYDRITSEPIAPHRKSLNAEQLKKFTVEFRELIRLVAYPQSGAFLRQAKVTVKKGKAQGKVADVEMDATAPEQDVETHVLFRWDDKGTTWRIIDASFDGSSMVKDYQNQFGRIIKKDGADALLKKISTKLEEARKEQ